MPCILLGIESKIANWKETRINIKKREKKEKKEKKEEGRLEKEMRQLSDEEMGKSKERSERRQNEGKKIEWRRKRDATT